MNAPRLNGIHHLKFPVTDIARSLAWYQRVFGARHLEKFDHRDAGGALYGVILQFPGVSPAVELRLAPHAAEAIRGYDPVSFAVADDDLDHWLRHLDALGVVHSPRINALGGSLVVFTDPDGLHLRLITLPTGGFDDIRLNASAPEPTGPWLAPDIMRRT